MKKVHLWLGILCCLAFAKAVTAQSTELEKPLLHVEPRFWWSEMKHHEVEVMFHGQNIAEYDDVKSDFTILNIRKTENANYLFITFDMGIAPNRYKINLCKNDCENGDVIPVVYDLLKRDPKSKERMGFDASDVIYLIMPDRFANGDPSNDSVEQLTEKADRSLKGGRHGGDIQGIIDHLDYIQELGATAVWSTPLLEDNDPSYSYHTYAQSDVYKIDPRYGTNADYKKLAIELHKRDMKLIMDYVTNHWGATHWMMQDLPTPSWIHQFENQQDEDYPVAGYANSSYRQTTQMDPNASERDKIYAEKGWFVSTMPDLNQSDPLVLNYLIQNTIWWIEFAGLDGLRVDTYSYNEKEGIATWTKAIMDEYPNFNIVGETWLHDQAQIAYWQKDSKIAAIQDYNTHLPSVMDFTLHDAITVAFKEDKQGWDNGVARVYENFVNDFLYPDPNNILVFAGNHDTNRINGDGIYNDDFAAYQLAMTLVLTTRGIPQLYYGDEIGMGGNKDTAGDGDIRRDFPGGWKGDTINAFKNPTIQQKQYLDFTKKLLQYRKNKEVLHNGKLLQYVPEQNCYVYFRENGVESVMVIINNNPQEVTLDLARFKQGIYTAREGTDILTDKKVSFGKQLFIPGKTSMVVEFSF